jgi:hypothetical protein
MPAMPGEPALSRGLDDGVPDGPVALESEEVWFMTMTLEKNLFLDQAVQMHRSERPGSYNDCRSIGICCDWNLTLIASL